MPLDICWVTKSAKLNEIKCKKIINKQYKNQVYYLFVSISFFLDVLIKKEIKMNKNLAPKNKMSVLK